MDRAHEYTDKEIALDERRINRLYDVQSKMVERLAEKYFSQFEAEDNKKKQELEDGVITKQEYRNWRQKTMMSGRGWNEFLKKVCKVIHNTNVRAVGISNNSMTDVFVENYNYIGKDIERQVHELR